MNVAIACGGTGGHLFPGIAVAQALRRDGHEVLLLVSQKDVDQHAFDLGDAFEVHRIPAVGMPARRRSWAMAGFACKLFASICKCQWLYFQRGVDVVLGMGGFTSAAAVNRPIPPVNDAGRPSSGTDFTSTCAAFPTA